MKTGLTARWDFSRRGNLHKKKKIFYWKTLIPNGTIAGGSPIAVKDQAKAESFLTDIMGAIPGSSASDPLMKYFWRVFSLGDLSRIEIISPTAKGSFLESFLENKGEGLHHITLQTPDIHKTMTYLNERNIPFFGYNEYPGGVWKEIFIHPKHANGVLFQIAEFEASDWLSEKVKYPSDTKWHIEKTENGATLTFAHPGGGKVSLNYEREELKKLVKALEEIYI